MWNEILGKMRVQVVGLLGRLLARSDEATKLEKKREQSLNRIEKLFAKLDARKVRPIPIESEEVRIFFNL